jgi:hypothetical protein
VCVVNKSGVFSIKFAYQFEVIGDVFPILEGINVHNFAFLSIKADI